MHAAILFLVALAPVETPKDLDTKAMLEKLQGVWKVTAVESNRGRATFLGGAGGGPAPGAAPVARFAAHSDTLVIVGNRYAFGQHAGTLKLDLSRRPHAVDFEVTAGPYKGDIV